MIVGLLERLLGQRAVFVGRARRAALPRHHMPSRRLPRLIVAIVIVISMFPIFPTLPPCQDPVCFGGLIRQVCCQPSCADVLSHCLFFFGCPSVRFPTVDRVRYARDSCVSDAQLSFPFPTPNIAFVSPNSSVYTYTISPTQTPPPTPYPFFSFFCTRKMRPWNAVAGVLAFAAILLPVAANTPISVSTHTALLSNDMLCETGATTRLKHDQQ